MVAAGPAPTAGTASRTHHFVPRAVKLLSVTAVAATTCALWALPARAATQRATTTTVSVAKSAFTFHVTVTVPAGTPAATGFVTVAPTSPAGLSAAFRCTATLAAGKGSCTIHPPGFGIVHYQASYSGSAVHISSKSAAGAFGLAVQNTTTTTVAPATAAPGAVTLIATVVNQAGSDISPPDGNGTVAFYVDGAVVCPAQPLTDASAGPDNLATCDDTLTAGSHTVDAVYSGDDTNVTSTGTVTLVVS
jgi:Bacterial Ig-like domain (group 3)